jgi:hypothetical protein
MLILVILELRTPTKSLQGLSFDSGEEIYAQQIQCLDTVQQIRQCKGRREKPDVSSLYCINLKPLRFGPLFLKDHILNKFNFCPF